MFKKLKDWLNRRREQKLFWRTILYIHDFLREATPTKEEPAYPWMKEWDDVYKDREWSISPSLIIRQKEYIRGKVVCIFYKEQQIAAWVDQSQYALTKAQNRYWIHDIETEPVFLSQEFREHIGMYCSRLYAFRHLI